MKLKNTNPLGHIDLPLIGRILEPGETFEVDDKVGRELLKQVGNYEEVKPPKARAPRKAATPRKKAAGSLAAPQTPAPASGRESVPVGTPDPKES